MGNETNLLDCSHSLSAQCSGNQQAEVLCPGNYYKLFAHDNDKYYFSAADIHIAKMPVDTTVNAQSNATFTCSAYSYPAPNIKWYKQLSNDSLMPLTDTTKYSMTTISLGLMNQTNELTIMSITLLAAGTYVCEVTNGVTNTSTSSATLTVLSEFSV